MKKQVKMLFILLTIGFSILSFASNKLFPAANATYVEGPITQDTVWTLVDSPFVVSNDVMVYPNVTLTIEAGVKVKFGGAFSLIVSGRLYANGMGKTITFTSNKEQPEVGDWNAIEFYGTEKSTLIGCFVAYAKDGIYIENGNVEIKSSTVNRCSQNGINANNGELTVQNSIIMENEGNGIRITGNGQVTIQWNSIIANGNGVLLTGNETSRVNIGQNKISANKENGIQFNANNHYDIIILNNNISSNSKGFYISSSTSTRITNNSISYNNIGILYDEGTHTTHFNDIYGNEMGMDVASNATVNAEHNYWGDASGPYHELLNPVGKGNPVGGDGTNLDFIFFLTKPIGYVNSRPTASLMTDKILIPQDEIVTFFATNSSDEGRVDRYFFDFGDGSNSGWTTLSIFTHRYSSVGTYYAKLTVMDDFGAISNTVMTTIRVQNLPPLHVSIELSDSIIHEGEQVSIALYVTDGAMAVENATVTMFSVKGGEFTQPSGFTNKSGCFVTTFVAPDVTEIVNVRIVARTSKLGYADGSDHEYLEVLPLLSVQITATPNVIRSEETAQIMVHVKSNGQPVSNASLKMLSSGGSLSSETGITDSNGTLSLVFSAPQTATFLNVTITAIATKTGFMEGVGQAIIIVEPKVLSVRVSAESNVTISEGKLNVTVHVESDMPIVGANVTIMAENGNFSANTELTNTYGDAKFIFTAPQVNEQTSITITAWATMTGYAENQSLLEIIVNPRTFYIQIIAPTVESKRSATVTVLVRCNEDETPVADATVTMSSTDGNFEVMTKTTDSTGTCTFIFYAPQTPTDLSVNITANVNKNGYIAEGEQTTIKVTPKTTPQAEGGWPISTILLIIIPIAIAVVIVILIKLKIIVVSFKEEEWA